MGRYDWCQNIKPIPRVKHFADLLFQNSEVFTPKAPAVPPIPGPCGFVDDAKVLLSIVKGTPEFHEDFAQVVLTRRWHDAPTFRAGQPAAVA
jgi:hypothetical protein